VLLYGDDGDDDDDDMKIGCKTRYRVTDKLAEIKQVLKQNVDVSISH